MFQFKVHFKDKLLQFYAWVDSLDTSLVFESIDTSGSFHPLMSLTQIFILRAFRLTSKIFQGQL